MVLLRSDEHPRINPESTRRSILIFSPPAHADRPSTLALLLHRYLRRAAKRIVIILNEDGVPTRTEIDRV